MIVLNMFVVNSCAKLLQFSFPDQSPDSEKMQVHLTVHTSSSTDFSKIAHMSKAMYMHTVCKILSSYSITASLLISDNLFLK